MIGGTSTLSWSVTNADSVSITPGTFSTSSLTGSLTVNPATSTTYTLTATNENGTAIATTAVSVGGPSWAYVQSNSQNSESDTNTLAFASPNQSGDLIIAEVDWTGGGSFGSIEDSQGNTYTEIGTAAELYRFGSAIQALLRRERGSRREQRYYSGVRLAG